MSQSLVVKLEKTTETSDFILPDTPSAPPLQPTMPISTLLASNPDQTPTSPVQVERDLETLLDQFQANGTLQKQNRMSIESLPRPVYENGAVDEGTAEEIYKAADVVQAKELRELNEINGGDDSIDELQPVNPTLPEPFAREMELLIHIFNRHIGLEEAASLKDTRIEY